MATLQQHPHTENSYLRPSEAASFLRLSTSTINKLRIAGAGPSFLKPGPKLILYKRDDLVAWVENGRRNSTSEYPTTPGPGRKARQ